MKNKIKNFLKLNDCEYDLYYIIKEVNEYKILNDNYLRNLELIEGYFIDFNEECKKNTFIVKLKDKYFKNILNN